MEKLIGGSTVDEATTTRKFELRWALIEAAEDAVKDGRISAEERVEFMDVYIGGYNETEMAYRVKAIISTDHKVIAALERYHGR